MESTALAILGKGSGQRMWGSTAGADNIAAATRHLGRQAERPLRLLGLA
jgi:hypothetical protein